MINKPKMAQWIKQHNYDTSDGFAMPWPSDTVPDKWVHRNKTYTHWPYGCWFYIQRISDVALDVG